MGFKQLTMQEILDSGDFNLLKSEFLRVENNYVITVSSQLRMNKQIGELMKEVNSLRKKLGKKKKY
jgi:hypothetical protein